MVAGWVEGGTSPLKEGCRAWSAAVSAVASAALLVLGSSSSSGCRVSPLPKNCTHSVGNQPHTPSSTPYVHSPLHCCTATVAPNGSDSSVAVCAAYSTRTNALLLLLLASSLACALCSCCSSCRCCDCACGWGWGWATLPGGGGATLRGRGRALGELCGVDLVVAAGTVAAVAAAAAAACTAPPLGSNTVAVRARGIGVGAAAVVAAAAADGASSVELSPVASASSPNDTRRPCMMLARPTAAACSWLVRRAGGCGWAGFIKSSVFGLGAVAGSAGSQAPSSTNEAGNQPDSPCTTPCHQPASVRLSTSITSPAKKLSSLSFCLV
eukprot:m.187714 g.187714  ORF g.187714 m.187714 type:complete len:325 (+) comp21628_c0_seq3:252-1226(+)